MSRFSLLYGSQGEPSADSARMRRRLAAAVSGNLNDTQSTRLGELVKRELGVPVDYQYGYAWERFLPKCELRDALDLVTLLYRLLNDEWLEERKARQWLFEVRRIFAEENVQYSVDEDGIVHFRVDEEFERARLASLAVLGEPRYANVAAAFERTYRELDRTPPDGKEAIRAIFTAAEGLFRLMFPKAPRLGSAEVDAHLRPFLEQRYAGQTPALLAAQKMAGGFKEWVTGAHFYRHEQGQEDVVQPPLGLAIATVGTGAAYLRWLAELDRAAV